jgi:hypothetical protein
MIMEVFIVKSFGPESGWINLKAFDNNDSAVAFANTVEKQIPEGSEDEFVEIEVFTVRS